MRSLYRTCLLAVLLLFAPLSFGNDQQVTEQLIQAMFPKATVIGDKTHKAPVPVRPVYQLNEVIGYAFESNDLVDLSGFSGERINLLIGIDTQGNFAGLELLHHHEPIFLHGLGEQPLLDFINQYRGHSVADRFIIGSTTANNSDGTLYFDGITKATVSVIVANDTILNSALKVARGKLAEFAQQAPAAINPDIFENMAWAELLEAKLVRQWQIDQPEVEEALGTRLEDFPDQQLNLTEQENNHIRLYYAYLNPPTVGRNLLGEHEYQQLLARLKPGEHAIAVMSEGFYPYLSEDFRPGTVPSRISLIQKGLPIPIRDTNFYERGALTLTKGAPQLDNLHVFRIRPQAGFNPSTPMQMQLIVDLAKNHLVRESASFSDDYSLPEHFFNAVEVENSANNTPIWLNIWQSRIGQIVILLIALALVSVAFAKQHTLSRNHRLFHAFRWSFLTFTLFFIGFYAQGQLSVVNIFTVLLALFDGFKLDVFLLDPIIFILWLYTFISLFLVGRGLFCGWLCPFGALQEMLAWLAKRLHIKQVTVPYSLHRKLNKLKYVIVIVLLGLSFYSLTAAEKAAEVEPFKTAITLVFVRHWPFVLYAVLLLGMGMFIHKFYCRYLCPLGAGLAVLGKFKIFALLTRRKECGSPCQLCRHRCEIGAIKKDGNIDYDECIQCLECIVIYHDTEQCAPAKVALKRAKAGARIASNAVQLSNP